MSNEAGLPNPPTKPNSPGMALFANDDSINLTSEKIDIGAVANFDVVATIDFRTGSEDAVAAFRSLSASAAEMGQAAASADALRFVGHARVASPRGRV